jgi:hypothetical protein
MPITIQEIIASDTISQLVDKTNFNFDQLLLNGGGPVGPVGPKGPTGPAGGRGPKGSTWYDGLVDPTTITVAPELRIGDYYLQDSQTVPPLSTDGDVWEYDGTAWILTTTNLQGPVGPKGSGGGFGATIGAPTINEQNIRYNGPIGLNNGATATNEGVPSVLIGGVGSNAQQLTGIPLTAAYVVPDTIIVGNDSTNTSLLIHQRNSETRGIVFHGGITPGLTDKYEQLDPSQLSNISIGIDDKIVINVPKNPTTPTSQSDLRGFELISGTRSQYFSAGYDTLFQSGVGPSVPLFAGQHSNFEINVGAGASNGDGNVFKTITQGTISSTLLEAGNTANITLVTNQGLQTGNWQLQAGEIRMISSTTKDVALYSGRKLILDTAVSGSNGAIDLTSGSGGILANSVGAISLTSSAGNISLITTNSTSIFVDSDDEVQISADSEIVISAQTDIAIAAGGGGDGDIDMFAKGDIDISQNETGLPAGLIGSNITIQNKMGPSLGSVNLGNVILQSNNQIKLEYQGVGPSNLPRISLDFTPNTGNEPVTRFVGTQTWAGSGGGLSLLQNAVTSQYNSLAAIPVNNAEGMFRRVDTGPSGAKVVRVKPGFRYEAWESLNQVAGTNTAELPYREPRAAAVVLGNETQPIVPYVFGNTNAVDRTLGFSVRTNASNINPYFENFSTNMNKTAVAGIFVWKRSSRHNAAGNKQPYQLTSATTYAQPIGSSPTLANQTNFPAGSAVSGPQYGFDYRSDVSLQDDQPLVIGMPTTDQLQPIVVLSFGNGVGRRTTVASAPQTTPSTPPNVDNSFQFPIGSYPGQQVTVFFDNYALRAGFTEGNPQVGFEAYWYGNIRLNIPVMRTGLTPAALASTGWYDQNNGVPTNTAGFGGNDGKRNYHQLQNITTGGDADLNITQSIVINMVWDGGLQKTWTKDNAGAYGTSGVNGCIQYGWRILEAKALGINTSRTLNT